MVRFSWGLVDRVKPFVGVIFLNVGFAGMDILSMAALKQGMSSSVFLVYANLIATAVLAPFAAFIDRNENAKVTHRILPKILLLSTMEAACGNLYFIGMKHTSATFAATMGNTLPALAFLLAWLLGLERVRIKDVRSRAKVIGTMATVAGAMIMTLTKGRVIPLPWTREGNLDELGGKVIGQHENSILGAALLAAAYFLWASFIIVQAIVLREYPAELSLTTLVNLFNTMECTLLALVMPGNTASDWLIKWDIKTQAALFNGVICVGIGYYIQAAVTKLKGPVFVTAFSPLSAVMVAIIASFVLAETLFLGRVIGAIIIIGGLYLVLWGKSDEYELVLPSFIQTEETHRGDEKLQPNPNVHQMEIASRDGALNINLEPDR
ncbi:WAT1-related protein At2g39510-like [Punica granatum]|uniref:WAT1-related protein n=2 Tax=Punica granatum TaxID=22663 RepID=A0A218XC26_PUNGR|nr:WAT1-related protein At2g39510-like [Punica granatum]OWM82338.1 hypothetical protein CDL15_Pgr001912 [Punica granatum]PKI62128.1 hypothetical protein CRG98_017501 [Punica granatum]